MCNHDFTFRNKPEQISAFNQVNSSREIMQNMKNEIHSGEPNWNKLRQSNFVILHYIYTTNLFLNCEVSFPVLNR